MAETASMINLLSGRLPTTTTIKLARFHNESWMGSTLTAKRFRFQATTARSGGVDQGSLNKDPWFGSTTRLQHPPRLVQNYSTDPAPRFTVESRRRRRRSHERAGDGNEEAAACAVVRLAGGTGKRVGFAITFSSSPPHVMRLPGDACEGKMGGPCPSRKTNRIYNFFCFVEKTFASCNCMFSIVLKHNTSCINYSPNHPDSVANSTEISAEFHAEQINSQHGNLFFWV